MKALSSRWPKPLWRFSLDRSKTGWIGEYLIANAAIVVFAVLAVLTTHPVEWHWQMPLLLMGFPLAVIGVYALLTGFAAILQIAAKIMAGAALCWLRNWRAGS